MRGSGCCSTRAGPGLTWPKQFGGRGLSAAYQIVWGQELARYDTTAGFITAAQALVGPTLMQHGTPEQQERYLGPLLSGEESWCQLFSEPGAGSDLAALATRAVRDGDEWVVNGQKVWTSSAQHADFGILVTRTDPDLPKHEGLTFFIVDMRSPGHRDPTAHPGPGRRALQRGVPLRRARSRRRTSSARSAAAGRSPARRSRARAR